MAESRSLWANFYFSCSYIKLILIISWSLFAVVLLETKPNLKLPNSYSKAVILSPWLFILSIRSLIWSIDLLSKDTDSNWLTILNVNFIQVTVQWTRFDYSLDLEKFIFKDVWLLLQFFPDTLLLLDQFVMAIDLSKQTKLLSKFKLRLVWRCYLALVITNGS